MTGGKKLLSVYANSRERIFYSRLSLSPSGREPIQWHGIFNPCFMTIQMQIIWLFVLAVPIACIAWTVTHEEVFREPREFCVRCSKEGKSMLVRKFYYLFTCEYCFSHYVTILFIFLTDYRLLMDDWRGYLIGGFSLVWIANVYMSLFAKIRIVLKRERTEVTVLEKQGKKQQVINNETSELPVKDREFTARDRHRGRKLKTRFRAQPDQPPSEAKT